MPRKKYTKQDVIDVIDIIKTGKSVRSVLKDKDRMCLAQFYKMIEQDKELIEYYERARLTRADSFFESIVEVADECQQGLIEPNAARVAIDAYKWTAGRMAPKRYGDKSQLEVDVKGELEITNITRKIVKDPKK